MYFFKHKGQQVLDLRGDLILSHNPQLVRARVSSAAPVAVRNGRYVCGLRTRFAFWAKLHVTCAAIAFIWFRRSEELKKS